MQKIHHYSPTDGTYLASDFARQSPAEPGVYLTPAFATTIEPPALRERMAAVFKDNGWRLVPDYRGVVAFNTVDGSPTQMEQLGVTPEDQGLTMLPPPNLDEKQARMFEGGAWKVVADWRGVPLFSTATGEPVQIYELGQLPGDVAATDKVPPSAEYSWVKGEWTMDAAKVAAAELERFTAAKAQALVGIDTFHTDVVARLVGNPTQTEKDTWAMKLDTAKSITAKQAPSPAGAAFLAGAGLSADADKATWAASVIAKSVAYATVVGLAERLRDAAKLAVRAATGVGGLQAALDEQRALANAAIAQLMSGAK